MSEAQPLGPIMLDLRGLQLDACEVRQLRDPSVGGVILFTRNYQDTQQLQQLIQQIRSLRPELLIAADTEGGRVQRFRTGFLQLPAAAQYGRVWDSDPQQALSAAQAGGWLLAAQLRAVDIDLAFAPVLDIDSGVSSVIGDRALADDPQAVAQLAAAFCRGMQQAGMAVTGKHYPGHGFVVPDSHVELPCDERTAQAITACDLQPYRVLGDQLDSIMIAHVSYPAVDSRPASISPVWIQQRLRQQMGFKGAVFSDDLSMGGLAAYGDVRQRVHLALEAGCDMLPVCNQPDDLAQLLDGQHWQADQGASQRLERLRRPRPWNSLHALHKSDEYISYYNALNNIIKVKVQD